MIPVEGVTQGVRTMKPAQSKKVGHVKVPFIKIQIQFKNYVIFSQWRLTSFKISQLLVLGCCSLQMLTNV